MGARLGRSASGRQAKAFRMLANRPEKVMVSVWQADQRSTCAKHGISP
jgi:hypothetical protein